MLAIPFAAPAGAAAGIGMVRVNDVLSCRVGADERPNCIDLIAVASRAKISLTK